MAEVHRKRRFIGQLNKLLKASIDAGSIRTSIELARLIAVLEGWTDPVKGTCRPAKGGTLPDQTESGLSDDEWSRLMNAAGNIPADPEPEDSIQRSESPGGPELWRTRLNASRKQLEKTS
jgi:hypothetical protein